MTKKTKEEKKAAQEVLAKFIAEYSNKTIEESFKASEKFLNQIKAKLEHKDIEIKSIFQVLDNVDYHQPIYFKKLPFISLCEHHLLPFFGNVDIGIFPSGKIIGVSKFAELIDILSRSLTLQEKYTEIISKTIYKELKCEGVFTRVTAKHLCSDMTNPKNSISDVITTHSIGLYELDYSLRSEALLNLN
tara:strand:- start:126 stop:692 length:567 start_codon:yes stop_codon:yes gene_type:complete